MVDNDNNDNDTTDNGNNDNNDENNDNSNDIGNKWKYNPYPPWCSNSYSYIYPIFMCQFSR